jgi:pyridoxal 5'-phosphate synthase pdxT subunit
MTHVVKSKIGILAIQGDFAAHAAMLHSLGAETFEVRTVTDLNECDALILPGGESTTQLQFLQEEGLFEAIKKFAADKHPIFGTCAGAILLAATVKNPPQDSLGLLDITVLRNAYGRQLASDVFIGPSRLKSEPGVEVLAEYAGKPALVRQGSVLASTFHPELTGDSTVHQYFLNLVHSNSAQGEPLAAHSSK